jgi:outer membrane protein assembly factor BamB
MSRGILQRFELNEYLIQYDPDTFILLCRRMPEGKNIWIRKIEDGGFIAGAVHDEDNFYISIESGEMSGQFIAINKTDGSTRWIIPGKAYLFQLFQDSIYLIFVDENEKFYLIKAKTEDGSKEWHYQVDEELFQYTINRDRITLKYQDGRIDILNSKSGFLLND